MWFILVELGLLVKKMVTNSIETLIMIKNILVLFLLIVSLSGEAQLYKTTWGVRLDDNQFGLSLTQKIAKKITIEAFSDFDESELRFGANARFHSKILGRRLNWYRGVGAIGGLLKPNISFWGASAVVGADYKFMLFPIVVSFDVNPVFYLSQSHPKWWSMQTVFSLKYVLVKEPKKKIFKRNDDVWQ